MWNKNKFEDELYDFVTARINTVYPELVRTDGDVLKFNRELLQAIHFVVEESVVQNICGLKFSLEAKYRGGK
jgi:hypothetical protein